DVGDTIKKLRKEREITQEEFAEILGVSCQSISRWENNSCYPDIELIPTIAAFFDISIDKLMGVDDATEKKAVDQYLKVFQTEISVGNIDNCIRIARAGVAEFPNNYTLLNKLMYALFVACSDDADIPNWKENQIKYDAEIVSIGERIIKYCPNEKIKREATDRLAFHHSEMGRKDISLSIFESLPSISDGKEWNIWWALSDDEK
ncbi:MAG: helix-turn-helix transcriptional regulator, partial [Clostridia bacterium]|nr:helix-turn-helix transcriptional regulator [Clostridia bacterium]